MGAGGLMVHHTHIDAPLGVEGADVGLITGLGEGVRAHHPHPVPRRHGLPHGLVKEAVEADSRRSLLHPRQARSRPASG